MAMYHLHVRFVKRSEGKSSVAAAAYRAGERLIDPYRQQQAEKARELEANGEQAGQVLPHILDFRHKAGQVQHAEVMTPGHVPDRLSDRQPMWGTVEDTLNYKTGQPAFEVEVALPRELSPEQRVELARGFAQREFVDNGLIVDLCIHMGVASDGGEHPHAHMLITTRRWDEHGNMTKAARDLQDKPHELKRIYALEEAGKLDEALIAAKGTHLAGWRERWADDTNAFLEEHGHSDRVDHRTLETQAVGREPTPNIGVGFYDRLREFRGHMAERVDHWKEVGIRNAVREQYQRIREHYPKLQDDFIAHVRGYGERMFPEMEHEPELQPQLEQEVEHER